MRMITSELKSAKILEEGGFSSVQSIVIVSMITQMDIHNLYSTNEVDIMLSETVEKVFSENRLEAERQRREFDEKMVVLNKQVDKQYDELKASRQWVIGTIITVGMGLAAYLSAIIKLSH